MQGRMWILQQRQRFRELLLAPVQGIRQAKVCTSTVCAVR